MLFLQDLLLRFYLISFILAIGPLNYHEIIEAINFICVCVNINVNKLHMIF